MGVLSPQFGNLIPSPIQQTLVSNYLNFADGGGNDFAQQYLPEIYEAEVERLWKQNDWRLLKNGWR